MHNDPRITGSIDLVLKAANYMAAQVEALPETVATAAPPDGGWTPAQIAYHVGLLNETMFIPAFAGTAPFVEPAPTDFRETFSFSVVPPRVKTAPFLEPPARVSAAEGVRKLRETTATLAGAMRSLADERLSHCAKLKFATVSMQQLAEFAAEHVTRHQAQLDRALALHG